MINFICPINHLGYGVHSYNLMKAYSKINPDIAWFPILAQHQAQGKRISTWLANREKYTKTDTNITIFHEWHMVTLPGSCKIGFPVFELEQLSKIALQQLNAMDYVFQTSNWGRNTLINLGIHGNKIFVIPEGYDSDVFKPRESSPLMTGDHAPEASFVHVGKWEKRKGTEDVVRVFSKASKGAEARLYLHARSIFNDNWARAVDRVLQEEGFRYEREVALHDVDNIRASVYSRESERQLVYCVLDRIANANGMRKFYQKGRFGLYFSKAEGWNLPLIETIASGVPCLTTDWTGQSEYLSTYPEAMTIQQFKWEIAMDGQFFTDSSKSWRVPDRDEMIDKTKELIQHPEKNAHLEACSRAVSYFTWDNAAKQLHETLNRLTS